MCVSSDFVPGTASLQLSTPSTLTTPDATARRYRGVLRNCRKLFIAMVAMVVSGDAIEDTGAAVELRGVEVSLAIRSW